MLCVFVRVAALMGIACLAWGQEIVSVGPKFIGSGEPKRARRTAASIDIPGMRYALAEPAQFALPELEPALKTKRFPNQTGAHRAIEAVTSELGAWISLPGGGRIWRAKIHSPGASSIRVHFELFDIQAGRLWVYNPAERAVADALEPYTGKGLHGDGEFWSGSVFADSVIVEFQPDVLSEGEGLPFRIDKVAHSFAESGAGPPAIGVERGIGVGGNSKEVAACHLDITCFPEWKETGSAIAHLRYETNEGSFVCSGALLNTRSGNGRPYLLTAGHCIASQTVATTLEAYFGFESEHCGSPVAAWQERIAGSAYLTSAPMEAGDHSLVLLSHAPAKAVLLGWTTADPPLNDSVFAIHHPSGSFKRISAGYRHDETQDTFLDAIQWTSEQRGKTLGVTWTAGLTQRGSSGSPLLNSDLQVIGMLSFGPRAPEDQDLYDILACEPNGIAARSYYGRFGASYGALRKYLDEPVPSQLTSPTPGATLTSTSVRFAWTPGNGVARRWLQVGSKVGGTDLYDAEQGESLAAVVSNLPTDGRVVYARLFSQIDEDWWYIDYAFKAHTAIVSSTVTLRLTNRLIYPVEIRVNNAQSFTLPASQFLQRDVTVTGPLSLSFEMIRPNLGGTPLGEAISGYFNPIPNPSGAINYTISNRVGESIFFLPLVSNTTATALLMEMNGDTNNQYRCNCTVPAFASGIALGYYRFTPASTVRAYRASWGYLGPYRYFYGLSPEAETGVVRLRFDQAP